MAISWDSFDKIWASTSPLTPYSFSDPNYAQGWNFVGSTPPARQMWDSIQKQNDEKFKYLRDNFGTPNIVTQASQMTDTDKVYVYLGSEAGWNSGHWYYYDEGTSSWADGGVYNSVAFVTDNTLSIAGQPADAKATGDALALKSDLAGCTFTGNVSVNADLSVTGDASIGTDLSVAGTSTLTGNVSASGDIVVVGDVSSANLTTSADATIGGDLSVTGASTLAGNITTSGDISADNISATTNGTVGGNLSVTGTSTLTGNINAGADINAVGDVSADNLTTTTNATVGGSLSVAGTSTLTGNVTTNGNINAVGDISSANLITTNATIGGNATVTGDVSCANLTTSADASVGGDLTVTGDSTLADTTVNDLVVNNDLSAAGDSSLTNLSVSGTTALAGTSTAPTPSTNDNSTKIATTAYVQSEIKPIEADVSVNDKRIGNIEKLLQGNLYDYQTDSDSAYTKTVPQGAMPYASLDSIGGKTLVWNQLNANSGYTDTVNGMTYTKNNDGSWTLNGTATSTANKAFAINCTLVSGHKYYIHGCPGGGSGSTYSLGFGGGQTDFGNGGIWTATTASAHFRFNCASGVTFNNVTIYPQYHDLTLMYGSGNEPTTVEEFTAQFPAQYYPYNAGTLLSAGVTEVVSKSKNIFNTTPYACGSFYYNVALGTNIAGTEQTIPITQAGTTLTYNVSAWGGCVFLAEVDGNKTYYVKTDANSTDALRISMYQLDSSHNIINLDIPYSSAKPRSIAQTVTTLSNARYIALCVGSSTACTLTITAPQIELGSTATTYSPYKAPIQYPIPAEIQALEGYGWSAGSVYNYIDYERKVFVKRVSRSNLGNLSWGYTTTGSYVRLVAQLYGAKSPANNTTVANITTPFYVATTPAKLYSNANDKTITINNQNNQVWVYDSSYTDGSTFESAMNGVYAYFELATPQEIDISAYLTDDNLIEVEAGGSLTFPNSNGTDYQIPVLSSETYMVDLQSAI